MASNVVVVTITTSHDFTADMSSGRQLPTIQKVGRFLEAFSAGGIQGAPGANTVDVQVNGGSAAAAAGTLTLATASGTVGGVIAGITVTVTASGGDTATATALKTAINADTNASKLVTATSAGAVVTLASKLAGVPGNGIKLTASGTGVTASGTFLTGGAAASAQALTF